MKNAFKIAAGTGLALTPFAATAAPLSIGALTFLSPWFLAALPAVPALWWLMRRTPRPPEKVDFPAVRFLFNLESKNLQPMRMPLWQQMLRYTAFACVMMGLAQPRHNPEPPLEGKGPLKMVIDNGWPSARLWEQSRQKQESILARLEEEGRPVVIIPSAAPGQASSTLDATEARKFIKDLTPMPWADDHKGVAQALDKADPGPVVWLSDDIEGADTGALMNKLVAQGRAQIVTNDGAQAQHVIYPVKSDDKVLSVSVKRGVAKAEEFVTLSASDDQAKVLWQDTLRFAAGELEKTAKIEVPPHIRAQLSRVFINGENTAGAVLLLDEQWRRRPVGVIRQGGEGDVQPLLEEARYIEKAISPYVELHQGTLDVLLKEKLAVLIQPDSAAVARPLVPQIKAWVEQGGTLLRFAGPQLAQTRAQDELLPLLLKEGPRTFGESQFLGREKSRIAAFGTDSPFGKLTPPADISINKQMLPRTDLQTGAKIWARLEDGTPLVSARQMGRGWVVLVHTGIDPEWSDVHLSGFFIDMLRSVVTHSAGLSAGFEGTAKALAPLRVLDGQGKAVAPGPNIKPLTRTAAEKGEINAQTPPGLYGNESVKHAHNLAASQPSLKPLPPVPQGIGQGHYNVDRRESDWSGWLLTGALLLALADTMVSLYQRGLLRGGQQRGQARERKVVP